MPSQKTIVSLASVLLCSSLGALPAPAAEPASKPAKQRLGKSGTMPKLPIVLPRQGMVLAHGSFHSTSSLWYTVDLERGEASRILARWDPVEKRLDIVEHSTRPIPPADLASLKHIANRIWTSTEWLPTQMATDVTWDLWQIDGDDVRRDYGPGMPGGLGKEAEQIMSRLVGVPAPA